MTELLAPMQSVIKRSAPVFDACIPTTGPLPREFKEWPSELQDRVETALAAIQPPCAPWSTRRIIATKSEKDPDGWFVFITAMDMPDTHA